MREAEAMGRIEHPSVVGVLDVGTEGSIAYLVMDILRGESLRRADDARADDARAGTRDDPSG